MNIWPDHLGQFTIQAPPLEYDTNAETSTITQVLAHPAFTGAEGTITHDIAIIYLNTPITNRAPVSLATQSPTVGETASVAGADSDQSGETGIAN
jgi:hypothetical protein